MSFYRMERSSTPSDETVAAIKRILIDHCNEENYGQLQSYLAWRYRVHAVTIRRIRTLEIYTHIRATTENLDRVLDGLDEYIKLNRQEVRAYHSCRCLFGVDEWHGYKIGAKDSLLFLHGNVWSRMPDSPAIVAAISRYYKPKSKRPLDAGVTTA